MMNLRTFRFAHAGMDPLRGEYKTLAHTMIDITTPRTLVTQMHPPTIIFAMLFGLALTSALLAGYGMAGDTTERNPTS